MAASYAFGATMGTAYSYGLGKYVLGGSAADMDSVEGAGVGQARSAFLKIFCL